MMASQPENLESFQNLEFFHSSYNIRFGNATRSREAILFLHGFPAEQSNKNIDVAQDLHEDFGIDTYLLHYQGLGNSKGHFTFQRSVEEAIAYAQYLLETYNYQRLHLVGHSWGGLVALNVFEQIDGRRGGLVLLAPFTMVPPEGREDQLARYFLEKHPHIFPVEQFTAVRDDLVFVFSHYDPQQVASRLVSDERNILVVHALSDDVIPLEMNRRLLDSFERPPHYVELDTDHRFQLHRETLLTTVRNFFKSRLLS